MKKPAGLLMVIVGLLIVTLMMSSLLIVSARPAAGANRVPQLSGTQLLYLPVIANQHAVIPQPVLTPLPTVTPPPPTATPTPLPTVSPTPSHTVTPTVVLNIGAAADPVLVNWFNSNCIPGDTLIAVRASDLAGQTCGDRQLLYNSAAAAEAGLPAIMAGAHPPTILGYDFEHRTQTPADEQADPVAAVARMRVLADRYHIPLLFAPDRTYGQQLAGSVAPLVDSWAFQLQQFITDTAAIHTYADPVLDHILAANPNLRISMQFRSDVLPAQILDLVNSFSPAHRPQIVSLLYTNCQSVIDLAEALR